MLIIGESERFDYFADFRGHVLLSAHAVAPSAHRLFIHLCPVRPREQNYFTVARTALDVRCFLSRHHVTFYVR